MSSHGDFTGLASDYARYRAAYAPGMPSALRGLARESRGVEGVLDFADVGAGTGIWTRMVAGSACRSIAVEPNDEMRALGQDSSAGHPIEWRAGTAEDTGLEADSCDLLTMASAFHWTDFERATAEFARVLRPGGVFAALWNTRLLEESPFLLEIEAELERLVPGLERVSSGRSAFCEGLAERLASCGHFADVLYLEGRHVERMAPERYLGLWRSVNDVRVQAGEERFARFLDHVAERTAQLEFLDAAYLTRTWAARDPR